MSDSNVIKEFLISLGFKLDKSGQQQFEKGIKETTAATVALGIEVAKAAEAVAKAVVKMATDLDQLYFASRRMNSAAENVKAFGFALEQLGGSAQGAQAALNGIASFMRSNPGGERFIQGMGVATRDAQGNLRDTEQILEDLGKKFARMPFYMAKVRAQLLGIDEPTLLAIENPDLSKETGKHRQFAASLGLGMDGGTEAANQFMEKMRDLRAEFDLLFVAGASRVMPVLEGMAQWLSQLPGYVDQFKASGFGQELSQILSALTPLWNALVRFGGDLWRIVGPAIRVFASGSLKALLDGVQAITHVIAALADVLEGKWSQAWGEAGKAVSGFVKAVKDEMGGAIGAVTAFWHRLTHPGEDDAPLPAPNAVGLGGSSPATGILGPSDGTGVPLSVRNNNPGNLRDPATGQYRQFSSAGQGAAAMQRQILRDFFVHGLRTVRSLINDPKWGWSNELAKGNSHASTMNYIASVAKALGISPDAQINMHDPATIQQLQSAMARFESGGFHSGRLTSAGPWGHGASIHQKTDIHVTGSDPHSTAKLVTTAQDRVNGNLIRNLKTAVA